MLYLSMIFQFVNVFGSRGNTGNGIVMEFFIVKQISVWLVEKKFSTNEEIQKHNRMPWIYC